MPGRRRNSPSGRAAGLLRPVQSPAATLAQRPAATLAQRLAATVLALLVLLAGGRVGWAEEREEGELKTDSQAPYVHRLTLYDETGAAINPKSATAPPYSPRATCGKCHAYAEINHGWHFNAWYPDIAPGRPGEPWLLVDEPTGTVLPLSARGWPGTFRPSDIGLSNWDFVLRFGGHLPGGGPGEPTKEQTGKPPASLRWSVSGNLEIDCMFCHSATQRHDPAEAAQQIEAQNFRWAPTVALGLAAVRGEARKAPDEWDPNIPPDPDHPDRAGPKLIYDKSRFDPDDRVLFEITRRPAIGRCYFCHTTREVGEGKPDDLVRPRDVHLAAGLLCVDCHRNETNHRTVRGFAGEAEQRQEESLAVFSCAGCHLGPEKEPEKENDEAATLAGRYGAPHPEHRGLPPVHFEKLTCTACHSGPWPDATAKRFKTAMAHGLGLARRDRQDNDPPEIVGPLFANDSQEKIAPHKSVLPAFWARLKGERVDPLLPDAVRKVAAKVLPKPGKADEPVPELTSEQIAGVLEALAQTGGEGEPVYIRNGLLTRRTGDGKLIEQEHPAAAACRWPMAHDVRPAVQALGARGCTDCHSEEGAIFFGSTLPVGARAAAGARPMFRLRDDEEPLLHAWSLGFMFRPAFKCFAVVCTALALFVLLRLVLEILGPRAALAGAAAPGRPAPGESWRVLKLTAGENLFHLALVVGALVEGATAHLPKLRHEEVADWWLFIHMAAAPLFMLGLTGTAVLWVRRRLAAGAPPVPGLLPALQRLLFWLLLATGCVVTISMLVAMWPIFGTAEQKDLVTLHGDSSLVFVILLVVHTIVSLAARAGAGGRAKA